jgi:hypothetical protein
MQVTWHFTKADQKSVKTIIEEQWDDPLVQERIARNLAHEKRNVTRTHFWKALVSTRLTTQARIIPTGRLATFQRSSPFALRYNLVRINNHPEGFILSTLNQYQAGRHRNVISAQLSENLNFLEEGGWNETLQHCNKLLVPQNKCVEAEIADYLSDHFKGFGPKQSRNLLQYLGLARYEIPLDSRVMKWLDVTLGFPFIISSTALADRHVYRLVLDAIQELCALCKVYPCLLDAAIFASYGHNDDEEL